MSKFNQLLQTFKENIYVSVLDTLFTIIGGVYATWQYFKKDEVMSVLEAILKIGATLAPFVMLWSFFHILLKFDKYKKDMEAKLQKSHEDFQKSSLETKEELRKSNLELRKQLFEVARLSNVLYSYIKYNDATEPDVDYPKYKTNLSALRRNINDNDLQLSISRKGIDARKTEHLENTKIFEVISDYLSILDDTEIKKIFKDKYNENYRPIQ